MSNFNIRINADANLKSTVAQFAALQAQVDSLNAAMERTVAISGAVNPRGYAQMSQAVKVNSQVTRNAALSTGMFEVQQLRLNSATEEYTKAIDKQKLSFKSWYDQIKSGSKVRQAAYKEQLALQQMVVQQLPGTVGGKKVLDIYIPNEVNKSFDTLGKRIGFVNAELKAASTSMINWGKNTQWAGRQLMVGFTVPMIAFGAAAAVMTFQVDKQITRIQKVYDTTAQSVNGDTQSMVAQHQELARVATAAMATATNAARQYGQAMTDTLSVQADLAATGLKGFKLQQSTLDTMRIATLGELDPNQAVTMTNALQSAFKSQIKTTEDLTNAYNYMNAVENQTSLSTQDIAEAVPRAASSMAALGVTLQQMITLMVAMKQNGVDAAEGANALKSATTRIINPVKKATEYYSQYGISLEKIRDESGGNLFEYLKQLGIEQQKIQGPTEKQTKLLRAQGVAMLFGTYQNSRLTAALTNLGDGFTDASSQTGRAIKLMGSDMESLAGIADSELSAIRNSVSGKFKIAIESVKAELSGMGEPFLAVATKVLTAIEKIMHAFNSMPDGIKKVFAGTAIGAAILGPLVMLTGLSANFIGNFIKMGTSIVGVATNFKLLNKEGRAAQLAAELAEKGFVSETAALQQLTAEMRLMTAAAKEGALAQKQMMLASNSATQFVNGRPVGMAPVIPQNIPTSRTQGLNIVSPAIGPTGPLAAATGQRVTSPSGTSRTTTTAPVVDPRPAKEMSGWMKASAVSGGLLAASMAATMVSSNGTVNNIAKFAMVAALAAPAFSGIAVAVKAINFSAAIAGAQKLFTLMATGAAATKAAAMTAVTSTTTVVSRASNAMSNAYIAGNVAMRQGAAAVQREVVLASTGAGLLSGRFRTLRDDAKIVAANIGRPGGLVYGLKAAQYHSNVLANSVINGVNAGIVRTNAGMTRFGQSVSRIGPALTRMGSQGMTRLATGARTAASGLARGGAAVASMVSPIGWIGIALGTAAAAAYLLYKHISSGKKAVDELYDKADGLGKILNFSPTALQTTLDKSGKSIVTMSTKVQAFREEYKNVVKEIKNANDDQTKFNYAMAQGLKVINNGGTVEQAKEAVEIALRAGAKTAADADAIVLKFKGQMDFSDINKVVNTYLETFNQAMKDTSKRDVDFLDSLIGGGRKELNREKESAKKAGQNFARAFNAAVDNGMDTSSLVDNAQKTLDALDKRIAKAKSDVDGYGEKERLEDIRKAFVKALADAGNGEDKFADKVDSSTKAMKLLEDLGYNVNTAVDDSATSANDLADNLDGATDAADGTADAADAIADAMKKLPDMAKSAMSSTQDALSSIASDNFTTKMNNAMDAYKKSQDARMDSLKASEDAESDAMDARWERRKKGTEAYYDARIKKVEDTINAEKKAEETRQKIFDAEVTRMQRWAEMQNTNIDFNVAVNSGNLDEAAKIKNDAMAKETEWALSDSADASKTASDARTDKLEKKKDKIEAAKDRASAALDAQEKAEKASLDRRQKAREKALQAEIDANVAAQQEIWDNRKEKLDRAIELFKDYIPQNEADLKKHVADIAKQYKDFNVSTKGEFNVTSVDIGKMLKQNVKDAANSIKNDISWAQVGNTAATDMIQGAFGITPAQFQTWLEGGGLPKGIKIGQGQIKNLGNSKTMEASMYHTGGIVGKDKGGRAGYGGHRDEVNTTLLTGEGVLNRKAMDRIGPDGFRQLNNGKGPIGTDANPYGGNMGLSGVMGAAVGAVLKSTIARTLANAALNRKSNSGNGTDGAGSYSAGKAGKYGDRSFSNEQLKNASIIASTGKSMGMSTRDIEIGIMTAITESGLINVNYGDRDSLGLFQQRPSQGWGTAKQVTDPVYASKKFFSSLKGVVKRGDMAPWLAAQAVQRSAYADGSNYKPHWNEAESIFNSFKAQNASGGSTGSGGMGGGYVAGGGGWHKASTPGKGWSNTHDYRNAIGSPLYAASDGMIVESRAITSGGSPGNGKYKTPYRSYGETIVLRTASGDLLRYAHLNPGQRFVKSGQQVKGGALIGRSGETGNAWGAHTHFDVNGDYNASGWMSKYGISLSKGAQNIKWDNTVANLHKGEAVLTEDINKQFREGVKRFAEGPNSHYNLYMNVNGSNLDADELVNKTMTAMRRLDMRKPQSRSGN